MWDSQGGLKGSWQEQLPQCSVDNYTALNHGCVRFKPGLTVLKPDDNWDADPRCTPEGQVSLQETGGGQPLPRVA